MTGGGLIVNLELCDEIGEAARDLLDDLADAPAITYSEP